MLARPLTQAGLAFGCQQVNAVRTADIGPVLWRSHIAGAQRHAAGVADGLVGGLQLVVNAHPIIKHKAFTVPAGL
jgi:hypothetical protein